MLKTPPRELNITEATVQNLIDNQIHELADLPLQYLDEGWDNVMYRLGEDYLIRLPRRAIAANLISNEQTYLNYLPSQLPINIPRSIFSGIPQDNYPWHWSVLPYFEGEAADLTSIDSGESIRFTKFLKQIHQPANGTAPTNKYRGVDLVEREADVKQRLESVKKHMPDLYVLLIKLWEEAIKADKNANDYWLHGDLHPKNILVHQGTFSAIVDWGDITSGDVATDLAAIWLMFDSPQARADAISDYDIEKPLLSRTLGWVIYFATVFYETGLNHNPRHLKIGENAFKRLQEDFQ